MPKSTLTARQAPLLLRAQEALGMSQTGLGEVLGATRKTVARWQNHAHRLTPSQVLALAAAVHPVDPELAAEVAAHGSQTLESLGIVVPSPPPAPPPAPPSTRKLPALAHLVDAVVMAAAEVNGGLSPQLRPILHAAFERADAMGLTAAEVAGALRGAGA